MTSQSVVLKTTAGNDNPPFGYHMVFAAIA